MPASGGRYGSGSVGDSVATELKRAPARRVSYDNTARRPMKGPGGGKFGGLSGGPSGGTMGRRGKR